MRILRFLTFVIAAIGVLAPSQAFAQDDPQTPPPALTVNFQTAAAPSFGPATFVAPSAKAATTTRRRTGEGAQGLGFFVAGGYVNSQIWGGGEVFPATAFDTSANGYFFGVMFGGNKSGWFGIGANVFYIVKNAKNIWLVNDDDEFSEVGKLEQQYLQVGVYGRVNFMGRDTKKSPTLYIIFGGFLDILLKGKLNDFDVKDYFNGFQVGPNFGIGFEAARLGVELRFDWSMLALNSTGEGTFLNGLEGTKDFKTLLIFFFRIN